MRVGKGRIRFAALMDNAFSRFLEEYRAGIDRFAAREGVDIAYFGLGSLDPASPEALARSGFLDFLGPEEFDGLIVLSFSLSASGIASVKATLERLEAMPMVSIGPSLIGEGSVLVDGRAGIKAVLEHLIGDHGYRDIAYVSGPFGHAEAAERLDAFREAMESAGIARSEEWVYEGDFLPLSGAAAVEELLGARGLKPQAIVCANDLMAIGVREGLADRGLTVPYDVAVTGFDDITILRGLTHQFTTVKQSFSDMGYAAAARLLSVLRGQASGPIPPIQSELVIRGSCGCVDLRDRKTRESPAAASERYPAIRAAIESAAKAGLPGDRVSDIRKDCIRAIHGAVAEKRSVEDLESAIWAAARNAGNGEASLDAFVLSLHAIVSEEKSQGMFVAYWRDSHTNLLIRLALDRLQEEIVSDLDWEGHAQAFREAAARCRARCLHLARFVDGKDLSKGARIVFSSDAGRGTDARWRPGPGAWLPPRGVSLVANMVADGADRFGYFLMDAAAIGDETFEHFRVRLSQIHHDAGILRRVRELNASMAREIEIRQDSEIKLKDALALVEQMAVRDQLTGLNNRRGFLTLAEQQLKTMKRQRGHCLLLFADMDGLKAINDKYGHKDGDAAIQGAARALKESLRDSDVIGRIGGDEFTALAFDAEPSSVGLIRDRIRKACERISREIGREWSISLSIGHFHAEADCGLDVSAMMEKADAALYEEKKRNKSDRN